MGKRGEDALPLVLKCMKGEEWPTTGYKMLVSTSAVPLTYGDITVVCPAGHSFKLSVAVRKKILTKRHADNAVVNAEVAVRRFAATGEMP